MGEREYDFRAERTSPFRRRPRSGGEPLMDGPLKTRTYFARFGTEALQENIVNENQEVYRLQGVNINDKHIECMSRQMLRWVKNQRWGDTDFLLGRTS